MLADGITSDLRAIRAAAVQQAMQQRAVFTLPLVSMGIHYGIIRGLPNGSVETSKVESVYPDLRVQPFFAHVGEFSLRAFLVGTFKDKMGLDSPILVDTRVLIMAVVVTDAGPDHRLGLVE
jgi:hypothetical protein